MNLDKSEEMTKDYYQILGVLDDAEDIVIKAAYKALAQKYHPDKWVGDKVEANKRMSDINEAYSVLSDPIKRKVYDSNRGKKEFQEDSGGFEDPDFNISFQNDWNTAIEYYPDLITIADNLAKISKKLEYTFKVVTLEKKLFNNRFEFAKKLEDGYLENYFGKNPQLILFAKELILTGENRAAKELNGVISVLGASIDPDLVIKNIERKFSLKEKSSKITNLPIAQEFLVNQNIDNAIKVIYAVGYEVRKLSLLGSVQYLLYSDDVKKLSKNEVIKTAHEFALKILKS